MSFFHLQTLSSVRSATITEAQSAETLNPLERAFLVKLRADKWPWIGIRCLTLTLADGSRYTPTLVSVIEGSVTCWEVADDAKSLGAAWPAPIARLLPWIESPTVYFSTAHRLGRGWLIHDVVPTSDIPEELLAARPTLERARLRAGLTTTSWDFRDWACDAMRETERKGARAKARVKKCAPLPIVSPNSAACELVAV